MNSPNKLYEELLKEHPELKNSQEDIQEIIVSLQKVKPDIQIDEDFKLHLKKRLDSIAIYNQSKSPGYFVFLKYFVPVFTFGFAIFGFMYFSQDTNISLSDENMGIQQASLMAEPLMMADDINEDSVKTIGVKSQQSPMGFALMDTTLDEAIDDFKDICLNENGLIKDLEEGERICILEEISCLESDYKKEKCLLKDKQNNKQ